jgi:hypothetical protein
MQNLKNGKRGKKIELTGRSPLRRQRSAMDCTAIHDDDEGGGGGGGRGGGGRGGGEDEEL